MDTGNTVYPVPTSTAARYNSIMLQRLAEVLVQDPEVDLSCLIPKSYQDRIAASMEAGQSTLKSGAAILNERIVHQLKDRLGQDPEVDLQAAFPSSYARAKQTAQHSGAAGPAGEAVPHSLPDMLTCLEAVSSATVVRPLSDTTEKLLASHAGSMGPSTDPADRLLGSLKQMFRNAEKLAEGPASRIVLKCNDELLAKILRWREDRTEYSAMQYLAEHAPDIPAPRAHGLVRFPPFSVMFISYVPSMTLTRAWPALKHEHKVSVQRQLDDIFTRLRELKQEDGRPLGGVGGERAKISAGWFDDRATQEITTAAAYDDFAFSIAHQGTPTYAKFLRNFVTPARGSVFSHGDVRPDNIMVEMDKEGNCLVKGIIDWGDGGFYPDYYESTRVTGAMVPYCATDWYLYLPPCIAPSAFPVRWLVDRLWDVHIRHGL
ncbi:MAG: hypothetical protein M1832_001036 [Thelocarpon impressellum]|nr:MAG: hypothetical protein M1832_001036 [Thelocarpon impressellum]